MYTGWRPVVMRRPSCVARDVCPGHGVFVGHCVDQILTAALSRVDLPLQERADLCLHVDEFQTFATENFQHMLSEGRTYGLPLPVPPLLAVD